MAMKEVREELQFPFTDRLFNSASLLVLCRFSAVAHPVSFYNLILFYYVQTQTLIF